MAPYSMDLRQRVVQAWDASGDAEEVPGTYAVSRAWVHRLVQRRRETGSIAPRQQTKFRSRVLAGQEQRLAGLITARPGATLGRRAPHLQFTRRHPDSSKRRVQRAASMAMARPQCERSRRLLARGTALLRRTSLRSAPERVPRDRPSTTPSRSTTGRVRASRLRLAGQRSSSSAVSSFCNAVISVNHAFQIES